MERSNKKQMCLSRKSWHRKLNKWAYGKEYVEETDYTKWAQMEQELGRQITTSEIPKTDKQRNGCSYFWGTFLAVTFCWFILICKGISRGFNWLSERTPKCNIRINTPSLTWEQEKFIKRLVGAVLLSLVTIGFFIGVIFATGEFLLVVGLAAGIIVGLFGLGALSWKVHDIYRETHPKRNRKEIKPNPVWTYIKARKEKACPCICWEN